MLQRTWDIFKTLMLTTLVAGMVWLFAEAETLSDRSMDIALIVQPRQIGAGATTLGESDQLVVELAEVLASQGRVPKPADTSGNPAAFGASSRQSREAIVRVEIEGAAARMDDIERELTSVPVLLTLGETGVAASTGEHKIDLTAALRTHPRLTRLGVSLQRVEPATLEVMVDELMVRELPVRVRLPEGGELEGAPRVSPARVRVRLPRKDAERLPADASVELVVSGAEFDRMTPGQAANLSGVRLVPPTALAHNARTSLEPAFGDVQLTIRSRLVEHVLPRVPVAVRMLPSDMAKWDVYITPDEQYLSNVRVVGPGDVIDRVRDGSLSLTATVTLSSDELQRGVTTKNVGFEGLPASVKVMSGRSAVGVVVSRR